MDLPVSPKKVGGLCLAIVLVTMTGCGPSVGQVNGNVTLEGKPLKSGMIVFKGPEEQVTQTSINSGRYEAVDVPTGPNKISILVVNSTVRLQESTDGGPARLAPPDPESIQKLPKRYADPETSELSYEVKSGEQTQDFDLKAK